VKPSDVSAFAAAVRSTLSPRTCAAHMGILRPAFSNFLPVGAANPFTAGKKEKRKSAANRGEESIHRIPFSPQELQDLLSATSDDPFMAGLITVKTSKTVNDNYFFPSTTITLTHDLVSRLVMSEG